LIAPIIIPRHVPVCPACRRPILEDENERMGCGSALVVAPLIVIGCLLFACALVVFGDWLSSDDSGTLIDIIGQKWDWLTARRLW